MTTEPLPPGTLVQLPGYSFRSTLHGPMVPGVCTGCGTEVMVVGETGRINQWGLAEDQGISEPRCSRCGRLHYGATQTTVKGQQHGSV